MRITIGVALLAALAGSAGCDGTGEPPTAPAGTHTSATTEVLKTGAAVLQGEGPLNRFDVYVVGFHPMKDDPEHQMEAHHFCEQVNEEFAQCVLFDGNSKRSNMTGVEYIISERLFGTLPAEERPYWHPHNGEILSGQLVAPGLPQVAEQELMRRKVNSYGKTWHTWATDKGMTLPLGPPVLAWSFSRDGEIQPGLVEARDRRLGINTAETRKSRADLAPLARPQQGVDVLKGQFGRPTTPIPGVVQK